MQTTQRNSWLDPLWILLYLLMSAGLAEARPSNSERGFSDLKSTFSSASNFSGGYAQHRDFTAWTETMIKANLPRNFESTNTHGFAFSTTTVKFKKSIDVLNNSKYERPEAQETFFPNIDYTGCGKNHCRAQQEVGPFLPDAHYISYYRLIRINDMSELKALKIPSQLYKDVTHFPKYFMLQLATDWSNYFHRANSITVFEPDATTGWIRISSFQTLSLTRIGAMGKSNIRNSLKKQVESFLFAFGKLP